MLPAAAAMTFSLGGCERGDPETELVERDWSGSEREFQLVDSSAERFRYQSRPAAGAETPSTGGSSEGPRLTYTTPEGWKEEPASTMRDINLSFGPNGEGECYVARLPGEGGGLLANVNRWRQQMGAEPLAEEEVAELPEKPLFGQPAKFISVEGDFSAGMGSAQTQPDYKMLGLILASDAGAVFVKMTGPKELVDENEEAFDTFTQSIDVSMN